MGKRINLHNGSSMLYRSSVAITVTSTSIIEQKIDDETKIIMDASVAEFQPFPPYEIHGRLVPSHPITHGLLSSSSCLPSSSSLLLSSSSSSSSSSSPSSSSSSSIIAYAERGGNRTFVN